MTKARDLADIISGGFTASDIPNLDASKITSGSIASARLGNIDLTNLSASNLTSGSIADARIPASAVSQHATTFDDNAIVNDLSTIALRQATNENAIAYNTNSSFVDVFQDSSGIASFTTSTRNASEYVSSIAISSADTSITINNTNYATYIKSNPRQYSSAIASSGEANFNNASDTLEAGSFGTKGQNIFTSPSSDTTWLYNNNRFTDDYRTMTIIELTYPMSFTGVSGRWRNGSGNSMAWHLYGIASNGYTTASPSGYPNISQASGNSGGMVNGTTYTSAGTWNNTTKYPYAGIFVRHNGGNSFMYDTLRLSGVASLPTEVTSATGNFIGNTITASSSTSSMGAIITYQDQAGTNALNTDIILQLSADNGSNFTTATLTALPDFSTGIKMAKVNDLTVTAGTQLKYKVLFANQSGSKEARIRGVSLQY